MSLPQDYQRLHSQIGRLLESAPDMSTLQACAAPAVLQWAGRAHALVGMTGFPADAAMLTIHTSNLRTTTWQSASSGIFAILYRALAHCELRAPAAVAGSFIPVGNAFDAYAALAKIFQSAHADVLVVDPYLDEVALTEFAPSLPEGIRLRLLADGDTVKSTLEPAGRRWIAQYAERRPLEVRLASPKALHDRAIFVDGRGAWTLTQSLKDFAKRSPAEIVRADDTASLKIAAYESIWAKATPMVLT